MSTDFTKDIEKLIDDEGYSVLLVTQTQLTCACFDTMTRSAKSTCPICLGTGRTIKVGMHKVLKRNLTGAESLSTENMRQPFNAVIPTRMYYFKKNAKPEEENLIVEGQFRGRFPVGKLRFYQINFVQDYTLGDGVQYYAAYTAMNPIQSEIKSFNLRKIGGTINYDPIREG